MVYLLCIIRKNLIEEKIFCIGKTILNYGITTFVVGSFMRGVFDIAGTSSGYLAYYFYIGTIFILIAVSLLLYSFFRVTEEN